MLNKQSWLKHAEELEEGRSRRVDHDCGEGRTLKVSREGNKLSAYCWRCNDSGKHKVEEPLAVRIARLNNQQTADAKLNSRAMPEPRTFTVSEWPVVARLWFYRAGLHGGDIGKLGAYYHRPSNRVVLPCSDGFWQARALSPGQLPKYMAPDVDKSLVVPRFGAAPRITLTEDVLSAYKVGQVGEGWCMLGTSVSQHVINLLLKAGKPVNVWLDNDVGPKHPVNRGQIAARKVLKTLRSVGLECRNIVAPRDPKLMTYEQIKELID